MCIESNMVAVRPFVQGTGCSGMTHSLTFADERLERDTEHQAKSTETCFWEKFLCVNSEVNSTRAPRVASKGSLL